MNFEASTAKALDKLNYFVENNLSDYSKLRNFDFGPENSCLLYTSPSPRDRTRSRMPSSA